MALKRKGGREFTEGAGAQVREQWGSLYRDPSRSHARIYSDWRHLPAFSTLTLLARCVLTDCLMDYDRREGAVCRLTVRGVEKKYSVGRKSSRDAIEALEERGWIARIGYAPGKTGQQGGLYRILCLDDNGRTIGGSYEKWGKRNRN